MDNYSFNIHEMLEAFGGDPNALDEAFHNALDQELNAHNQPEDIINVAANDVACLWNEYINFYINQKNLNDTVDASFFVINPNLVITLTEALICAQPILKDYLHKDET